MIIRHIPMKSIRKSSFAGLVYYITSAQGKQERVGQVRITNCHSTEKDWAIHEVMATQAHNQRAKGDKTYHLLISFAPNENPSAKELKEIEEQAVASLGFSEHQRISAVHYDTDNSHIHIAINKTHPKRHTLHDPFRAYKTLGDIAQNLEIKYGLQQTNHSAKKVRSENLSDDMEHHAGIESLLGWIKRNCLSQLEETQNWSAFYKILNENGLEIRERGNGFIILNCHGLAVKASSISRSLSKSNIEKRLGKFEPLKSEGNSNLLQRHYEQRPINRRVNTTMLFARYQTEQKNNKTTLSEALTSAKKRKNRLIDQVKRQGRLKRAAIKLMKGHRANKKILYTLVSKTLQSDIKKIRKQYSKERQFLADNYQRSAWTDWLQKQAFLGNREALSVLRFREIRSSTSNNIISGKREADKNPASNSQIDNITKEGTLIYRVGSCSIRDSGSVLKISKAVSKEELKAAIQMARDRFGQCIRVEGSELFKKAIVQTSAHFKLNITFEDTNLEKQRQNLITHLISKEKNNEQTRQLQFNNRTGIRRSNEIIGTRLIASNSSNRRGGAATKLIRRPNKPNINSVGGNPPPESKNCLRNLSQLSMVQFTQRSEMLLSGNVHDQLERQRAEFDNKLRRKISRTELKNF
ncbi:TraI/MobA(P) family conjugative relaxase [Legionella sp.]|uniref:TraI/MobA(P) family conjugative relaxase n=1 Tax=Legionella sp. TaxID=459 RepID=UPI000CB2073E|nr:TraI/MobA(P) family conjugative relaxase [Legionella sp.]PJE14237.1 MAG: conjugal transfer protein TraI [Legionella sp.]